MMEAQVREVEIIIISDVHLGTYGAKAHELSRYLNTVNPKKLILNGDILDGWQFSKSYFPQAHLCVIRQIFDFIAKGTEVIYITGNHDEMLRKFTGVNLGRFRIENKVVLKHDGKKTWVFHGDVFDVTMQHSKWIARAGAYGYGFLMLINRFANFISTSLGGKRLSLAKKIKSSVKNAVQSKHHFADTAAELAAYKGYDYVACGHIHQPEITTIETSEGTATYLNSGDWMDNLTALEYHNRQWTLYSYFQDEIAQREDNISEEVLSNQQLFAQMVAEFQHL
ncbi:MAG: UDP-2,3-diacylglucosamine diphosphatase [Bacteroidota bacterium]